jgi:hypothetical protein
VSGTTETATANCFPQQNILLASNSTQTSITAIHTVTCRMHTMICTQQHSSLVQHRGRAACPPSQHQVQLQQCRTIMACTVSRSSLCTAPQCQQHVTSHSKRLPPLQAAPDWDFDFDKNPQNTQNPQVRPLNSAYTVCSCIGVKKGAWSLQQAIK